VNDASLVGSTVSVLDTEPLADVNDPPLVDSDEPALVGSTASALDGVKL